MFSLGLGCLKGGLLLLTLGEMSSPSLLVVAEERNFLPSYYYSLSCWTAYSSMGSTSMKITSYPLLLSFSKKGERSLILHSQKVIIPD
jgi:hypothetical protein